MALVPARSKHVRNEDGQFPLRVYFLCVVGPSAPVQQRNQNRAANGQRRAWSDPPQLEFEPLATPEFDPFGERETGCVVWW
jgi:hypothetical protein